MTSPIVKSFSSQTASLKSGLYLVATPIGHLRDITLRALDTLHAADLIACEDTRVTATLLKAHGIATPTDSYHEHNAAAKRPALLKRIASGQAVALVSDAGTPLISDPGYKLVREAAALGLRVEAVPGASSVLAALSISALPTDRFCFCGFMPARTGEAKRMLTQAAAIPATLIFFAPARTLPATLALMVETLGPRPAAVTRELTKLHEEARRGGLAELAGHYAETGAPKGEVVIVIGPPQAKEAPQDAAVDEAITRALATLSLKDAAAFVAAQLGLPRSKVYQRALALKSHA